MPVPPRYILSSPQTLRKACGGWLIAAGVAVLLGWVADVGWLRQWYPTSVPMSPLTAIGFVLLGAALCGAKRWPRIAGALALMVVAVSLERLLGAAMGWPWRLDRRLGEVPFGPGVISMRMAPQTAVHFLGLGLGLCLGLLPRPQAGSWSRGLAWVTLLASFFVLTGYGFGIEQFFFFNADASMAVSAALSFAIGSAGVLLMHPDKGTVGRLWGDTTAGMMLRRALPAAVLFPLLTGGLRLEAEQLGWVSREVGVALAAFLNLVFMVGLLLVVARRLEVTDVERRQLMRERMEEAARVRDLYDHAPCGYHSLDAQGEVVDMNETELRWLGYTREEVVGKMNFRELLPPEGVAVFVVQFPEFLKTGATSELEFSLRRKDGSVFPVLVSATAVKDEAGHFLYSRTTVFDITDRKLFEEAREAALTESAQAQRQLADANRELESFSYSVSHDLRAPLRHMDGFVRLLETNSGAALDEKGRRYVAVIRKATSQMGQLIEDLLDFSRLGRSPIQRTKVDMAALVEETRAEVMRHEPDRQIEWVIRPLPRVEGDRQLLRVVWVNLLANAVKYSRPRSPARIEVRADLGQDGEVVFQVKDNGVGFDMKYAKKLFGVFQRLHRTEDFEGTGIGLATVQRIIHRHGGQMRAEGACDVGAAFYFSLPTIPKHE